MSGPLVGTENSPMQMLKWGPLRRMDLTADGFTVLKDETVACDRHRKLGSMRGGGYVLAVE